ncbi:MAG: toll/interleukin-1 receptor domain-containing protein [Desulfobacterales bacterium]|jgi:hypothetical protein
MSDIFISYAREDGDRVIPVAETLEKLGWSVWWDRTIPAGKTYAEVIEEALTDARCIVVLWSRNSISSNWVIEEAEEGLNRGILVPIFIESVKPPLGFRRIQAADLINWDGKEKTPAVDRFVSDIAIILGPPPAIAAEEGRLAEEEAKRKAEEEHKQKEAEAQRKAEEKHREEQKKRELDDADIERDKTNDIEQPDPEPTPISNHAVKIGALVGIIVLLIFGIKLFTDWQKEKPRKELLIQIDRISEKLAFLEEYAAQIEGQDQLHDLKGQKEDLANRLSELEQKTTDEVISSPANELRKRLEELSLLLILQEERIKEQMESPDSAPPRKVAEAGRLFVETMPEHATVRILNITPTFQQGMELKPGDYHLEISAEGFEPQRHWIGLEPGHHEPFRFELVELKTP